MPTISDNDLVLRTRQGDADAYGALVLRHQNAVFNVCLRLLGEPREAEDLTQDAFIRGYRHLDSFDNQRPFGPWIRRIATNLCLNHLKRRKLPTTALMDELDHSFSSSELDPVRALVRNEQDRMVREAILSLPPHYRAVIELRHFQDLSYAEIAETLQIPLSDVRSHLYRARKALKKVVENRSQKPEVRGQKPEVGSQKPEVRGQSGGGRKANVDQGRPKQINRRQNLTLGT